MDQPIDLPNRSVSLRICWSTISQAWCQSVRLRNWKAACPAGIVQVPGLHRNWRRSRLNLCREIRYRQLRILAGGRGNDQKLRQDFNEPIRILIRFIFENEIVYFGTRPQSFDYRIGSANWYFFFIHASRLFWAKHVKLMKIFFHFEFLFTERHKISLLSNQFVKKIIYFSIVYKFESSSQHSNEWISK